jgi:fusion and transport protein UGO1
MSQHREGVNPLRPYYIPPTIGDEPLPTASPQPFIHGNSTRYASKARDIFSDIDYKDYISDPSPSAVQSVKALIDELIWKYTSVLMAQPFEVAKTLLQVRSGDDLGALAVVSPTEDVKRTNSSQRISLYDVV